MSSMKGLKTMKNDSYKNNGDKWSGMARIENKILESKGAFLYNVLMFKARRLLYEFYQ